VRVVDKSASLCGRDAALRSTRTLGPTGMNTSAPPRPKRLWVIAVINVAVALLSIGTLAFLLLSSRVPAELRPPAWSAALSSLLAAFLIVSCVLALLGYRPARWLALGSAVLFFGILLTQSLLLLVQSGASLPHVPPRKLWANVVRNSIEIALNLWVFLGAKTAAFFRGT
jgi:hypothetical protein